MRYFFKKYCHSLLFITLFSGICLYYNFQEIFQYSPRSFHQWRQTDSASTALNYYQDGLNFFKPRMHYVMGGEGYVTGAGEAPVFYYLVALFYKIFGPHDSIFRLLSLATLLIGFYFLSKIILEQSQDLFAAVLVPAFLMGSPVVAFYSLNYTPNIPAQGFAIIGIWFFYQYYQKSQLRFFYWSMLFFALAGLIKISSLIPFFVIFGLWIIELLQIARLKKGEKLFKNSLKIAPVFLLVLALIFSWKWFADYYNELHQTNYFLSKIRPIWSLDVSTKEIIWNKIINNRLPSFFNPYTFWTITVFGVLILLTPRKHSPVLYFSFWFYLLGSFGFFVLMFKQFEQHDYYAIEMMLLPIIILSMFIFFLKKNFPSGLKKWWFRLMIGIALIFNLFHTKTNLDFRYDQNGIFMSHFNPAFYKKDALQLFLKNLNIHFTDKVVSAPDLSPNNTLYYLNLRGWTEYFIGDRLIPVALEFFISSGAQYLIINDASYLESEDLKPFLKYPMGVFENSIFVFDIRPFKLEEVRI